MSPAAHLFVGEEDLLIEEGVKRLLDESLPSEQRALNLDVLDGGATPMADVLARLDTLPFFGDARVVVVKDIDAYRADDQRALADYLERGVPPTVAIFTADALDRRSRLFKSFQKTGAIHACDPMASRDVPRWVERQAQQLGKRMEGRAAEELVDLAGTSLRVLRGELEKLAAYVGERTEITSADVDALASRLREAGAFALSDALGERNVAKAIAALTDMLEREHALPVLGMIAANFRRLLQAKASGAKTEGELARMLNVHPYRAGKLFRQSGRYRMEDFPRFFELLEEADREIKSMGRPELALETLVVRLCGESGGADGEPTSRARERSRVEGRRR